MKVLLIQLDGKIPNIALMRIAAHHTSLEDEVELRRASTIGAMERGLFVKLRRDCQRTKKFGEESYNKSGTKNEHE